jgi:tellurite resistance protein
MRPHTKNSPHAAARLVALTLISDGQLKRAEMAILERSDAHADLGLRQGEFREVVHGLCADLLHQAHQKGEVDCLIDKALIERLLTDVDDAAIRRTVLRLAIAVVHADGQVHDGESIVLLAMIEQWGVDLAALQLLSPN